MEHRRVQPNDFSPVLIILLFGHFLIPFPGLLSRHVKRNRTVMGFWAVWVLAFCWLDVFWLVVPQLDNGDSPPGPLTSASIWRCCWA